MKNCILCKKRKSKHLIRVVPLKEEDGRYYMKRILSEVIKICDKCHDIIFKKEEK